ncbi:hypothetical protein GOBAR_AA35343 [Gossypium barbadense]|uniref:Arabidopsis retrotransposon Orf1 C-terminal domain-containing protein n=1 Tax=Gossypium barbadense TaxID=3634 RepID=A0A2P5W2M1_GOSBA|nr:hypothetical protein GOBAR_AA35343 [Gossypium barbadense]
MTNTRGKKTTIPALKKRKGPGATSLSASTEARHPLLRFSSGPEDDLFQLLLVRSLGVGHCIDWTTLEEVGLANEVRAFITTAPWDWFFVIIEPTYSELTLEFCTTFHLQHVMNTHDEVGIITFRLGGLVRHMSVPEFGAALDIYTDEFIGADNFLQLHRHIHYSPLCCWTNLTTSQIRYDASHLKATSLSPTLRYIHVLLAHTLTGNRERTGVVSTTDTYCLWSMATGHICDLAYFIALAFRHQTDRHRKGPIYLGPYVTRLARHFGLFNTPEMSSTLTLDKPEDITDDVPPLHEDLPPPPSQSHIPTAATIDRYIRTTHSL